MELSKTHSRGTFPTVNCFTLAHCTTLKQGLRFKRKNTAEGQLVLNSLGASVPIAAFGSGIICQPVFSASMVSNGEVISHPESKPQKLVLVPGAHSIQQIAGSDGVEVYVPDGAETRRHALKTGGLELNSGRYPKTILLVLRWTEADSADMGADTPTLLIRRRGVDVVMGLTRATRGATDRPALWCAQARHYQENFLASLARLEEKFLSTLR